MCELKKSHIRLVTILRAFLAVVGKWLIGVLIGKIIKAALGLEDVFDQANPLYDVVLLNAWDFHTVVVVASIEIVLNVIVAACLTSLGALWAVQEGRRWRKQVLESALGKTNASLQQCGADELLTKIQVIEDFVAFDEHSILFNWIRLGLCMALSFVFTWYAGVITIVMTILSEVASKLCERMRDHLHTSIQDNQLEVNQRLVDVIKNHVTVKVMGTAVTEIRALGDLERKSDEQRQKDALVKCIRDVTKLVFTALVPIFITLVARPIVTSAEQTSDAINAATALFVTMLLLDEVHKSLISLSFVRDRQVAFHDAQRFLKHFATPDAGLHPEPSSIQAGKLASDEDDVSLSNTGMSQEQDLEAATTSQTPPLFARRAINPHFQVISLDNVSLQYPGRDTPVLHQYSNSFQRGQIHGLVGESGSGKSTTLKIVANLLEAQSGTVQVWEGMKIAYVSQDQTLLRRTIRENVTYGTSSDSSDDEAVWKALQMAHLDEWVKQLPKQLDHVLDEKSVSGGQLQRLHLAHLFCCHKDTDCVLLDECLSALDEACRESLIERLQVFLQGKTTLLITHHSEMLRICNQIHTTTTMQNS